MHVSGGDCSRRVLLRQVFVAGLRDAFGDAGFDEEFDLFLGEGGASVAGKNVRASVGWLHLPFRNSSAALMETFACFEYAAARGHAEMEDRGTITLPLSTMMK